MIKNKIPAFAAIVLCTLSFGCRTTPQKESSVVELILSGKQDEAKNRFQTKYDINAVDKHGNTALHAAAQINDADLVTFLIIKGADTDLKNYDSDTALHVAIKHDSFDAAKVLAAVGGDLFARDGNGTTALDSGLQKDPSYYDIFITTKSGEIRDTDGESIVHYFVKTKNEQAVKYCIKKQLPLSVVDNAGKTPLDAAFEDTADETSVEIAADLIMGGAEHVDSAFSYFQDAVANRNLDYRFDDGQTPLHIAASQGHSGIAKYLLENNATTHVQDIAGATPLHEAVRYGHADIAKMLLDSGADVNAEDNLGKTPIMLIMPEAARKDMYSLLISYHADVTRKDTYGDTVLHSATMTNLPDDILGMLVSAGADVNARNKDGVTPLAIAMQQRNAAHVKFYAEHGADINSEDKNGTTPLSLALKDDESMLEMIVNKSNVMSHDSAGNTPLHVAIMADASLEKIQYILSLMDNVNARNSDGDSALYLAVLKNRQKLGELLLAKKADIFSTNNKNYSPLHLALKSGGSVQDWLITSQTITATDGSGNTALHYAAEWELKDAVTSLLEKGANPSARNANGETPVFNAVKTNDSGLIDTMVKGGSSVSDRDHLGSTPLHVAVRWDADNSARELIRLGIDVNAQNISGKSALAEAVLAGKLPMAKLLIDAGADTNTSDSTGRTILMDAVRGQNTDVITMLLDNRANPQIQEINGRNAYHEAALTGNTRVIAIIRNAGGNPLSRDKNGNTPFSLSLNQSEQIITTVLGKDVTITDSDGNTPVHVIVQSKGPEKILSMLVALGYPTDTRNADGCTPLSYAVENNYENYALILLQNGANPFSAIDKKGRNAATIALDRNNDRILAYIVKYAGTKSDIQGNTILHYAARMSTPETIQKLLSYGLDVNVRNISGETPYMTALRWKRNDAAAVLLPKKAETK